MSPDPYDGSYDASNPQSFNRYAYVLNSSLSWVDPIGLGTYYYLFRCLGNGIGNNSRFLNANGEPGYTWSVSDNGYNMEICIATQTVPLPTISYGGGAAPK